MWCIFCGSHRNVLRCYCLLLISKGQSVSLIANISHIIWLFGYVYSAKSYRLNDFFPWNRMKNNASSVQIFAPQCFYTKKTPFLSWTERSKKSSANVAATHFENAIRVRSHGPKTDICCNGGKTKLNKKRTWLKWKINYKTFACIRCVSVYVCVCIKERVWMSVIAMHWTTST